MKKPLKSASALASVMLMAAQAFALTDNATVINAAADIRDIRGPISIPYAWLLPVCIAGLLAAAAIAGFAAWRWYQHRKRESRMLSAHERAFENLNRARALMQEDQAYAFSSAVSDAVREYIECRFAIGATRATTEEFLRDISGSRAAELSGFADLLQDFLTHCDLAKFARYRLSLENMQALHGRAWQFVDTTKVTDKKTAKTKWCRARRTGPEPVAAASAVETCARTT